MSQSKDPVYVSSDNADHVLLEIQRIIQRASLTKVAWPGDFDDFQDSLEDSPLDLLSHSYGDEHLLLLGDIEAAKSTDDFGTYIVDAVDQNQWMEHLINAGPSLKERGLTHLRLLGCITAWSDAGRATITTLRKALDINMVSGTKDYLSAIDFNKGGLKDTDKQRAKLVSSACIESGWRPPDELPPLPAGALGVKEFDLDKVPALSVGDLRKSAPFAKWALKRSKLDKFDTKDVGGLYKMMGEEGRKEGRSLPGLLTVPTHEYWIPVAHDPLKYRLMQALFGWRMLRVYSPELMLSTAIPENSFANSAVYQVAEWRDFKSMMDHLPQVEIPQI